MKSKFTIELVSDVDFEGMVVDISLGNVTIAHLNYDKGIDKIEMEFESISPGYTSLQECSEHSLVFSLDDFLHTLDKAKALLIKCHNEDKAREE